MANRTVGVLRSLSQGFREKANEWETSPSQRRNDQADLLKAISELLDKVADQESNTERNTEREVGEV